MTENEIITANAPEQSLEEESGLDLIAIAKLCLLIFLRNWKWFLLSVCLCLFFTLITRLRLPNSFTQIATILLEDTRNRGYYNNNSLDALKEMSGVRVSDQLKDEIFVLTSRRLMEKVVDKLNLTTFYTTHVGLRPVSLFEVKPFTVTFDSLAMVPMVFEVEVEEDNTLTISNMETEEGKVKFKKKVHYGQPVKTPAGTLTFTREKMPMTLWARRYGYYIAPWRIR